jgi:hypothetical protein
MENGGDRKSGEMLSRPVYSCGILLDQYLLFAGPTCIALLSVKDMQYRNVMYLKCSYISFKATCRFMLNHLILFPICY